jgi:Flp pilus assembly protein TadD
LASVYTAAKEHEKSEEQLKAILREDPDDATANNDLGYQWADQSRNLAAAERMIRKAIELDKQQRTGGKSVGLDADRANAAYLDSLGWVLFRRGDLAGARRELETASTLPGGDDDPVVWDHLGDVLFKQGDVVGARRSWQKCVTLFESTERRRRPDERYEEVKQKLRQQESATPRAGR